jgi:hypothetical protein
MRRWPFSMNTTTPVTSTTTANTMIAAKTVIAPVRTSSSVPPIAAGSPATIPAKMIMEMPLPMPRSVICSPSHMRKSVPVVSVITVVMRNMKPGSSTSPCCDSSATEMPSAWKSASTTVP